jgi:O-methyltransferase involved in polyketide biosynthesis
MNTPSETAQPRTFGNDSSFTADIVAYSRSFTTIGFAQQIYEIACSRGKAISPQDKDRIEQKPEVMAFIESRFLMTDRILIQRGITQIYEMASGLSPRSLIWTRDQNVNFVELDLPTRIAFKAEILKEICGNDDLGAALPNLSLVAGDALSVSDSVRARAFFDEKPVGVITEGLLHYLDWEAKDKLAKIIRNCLERFGGVWITPDIELLSDINNDARTRERFARTAKEWGMDVRPNLFTDMMHAISFFESFGFRIEEHQHSDLADELSVVEKLCIRRELVRADLRRRVTFALTL